MLFGIVLALASLTLIFLGISLALMSADSFPPGVVIGIAFAVCGGVLGYFVGIRLLEYNWSNLYSLLRYAV